MNQICVIREGRNVRTLKMEEKDEKVWEVLIEIEREKKTQKLRKRRSNSKIVKV